MADSISIGMCVVYTVYYLKLLISFSFPVLWQLFAHKHWHLLANTCVLVRINARHQNLFITYSIVTLWIYILTIARHISDTLHLVKTYRFTGLVRLIWQFGALDKCKLSRQILTQLTAFWSYSLLDPFKKYSHPRSAS